MYLSLGLTDISSPPNSDYGFLAGILKNECCVLRRLAGSIIDDVTFDYLVKVSSARFWRGPLRHQTFTFPPHPQF